MCHSFQNLRSCNSILFPRHLMLFPASELKVQISSCEKKFALFFENILSLLLSVVSIILTLHRITCFIILYDVQEVCKLCIFHRDSRVIQHLQLYEKSLTGTYLFWQLRTLLNMKPCQDCLYLVNMKNQK